MISGSPEISAHRLQWNTAHGHFDLNIELSHDGFKIASHWIKTLTVADPKQLPWRELDVDVVYECTELFTSKDQGAHTALKLSVDGSFGQNCTNMGHLTEKLYGADSNGVS